MEPIHATWRTIKCYMYIPELLCGIIICPKRRRVEEILLGGIMYYHEG